MSGFISAQQRDQKKRKKKKIERKKKKNQMGSGADRLECRSGPEAFPGFG